MTRKRSTLQVVVAVCLCAALIAPAARAERRAGAEAAEFLPPDTIAYVSVGSEGLKAALEGSGLVKILQEQEVQQFIAPLLKKVGVSEKAVIKGVPLPQRFQAIIEEAQSVVSGPIVIALTGFPTDLTSEADLLPGVVVIADVRGKEEAAKKYVETMFSGTINRIGRTEVKGGFEVKHIISNGYLVLSISESALEAVTKLMEDPSMPSLADKPRFKTVASRISTPKNIFNLYVDLNMPMLLLQGTLLQMEPKAKQAFAAFGLESIEAVGASMGVDGPGFKQSMFVYAPGARSGLMHTVLSGRALAATDLKLVPEDALAMIALSINPKVSLEALKESLRTVGEADDFERRLAEFREELGFSLEEDLLPSIETPLLVYARQPAGGPIPEAVALLKLRDGKKFGECVDKLLSKAPEGEMQIQEYNGRKIYVVKTGGPVSPSFTVAGDYALGALFPHTLKAAISRLGEPGLSVADAPAYQAALGRLSAETHLVLLVDMKRIFNFGYGAAMPFLMMAGGNLKDVPVDLSALPMADTVSQHMFVESYAVAREKDGIAFDSYGLLPSGIVPSALFPMATLATRRVAVPESSRASVPVSGEARILEALKSIAAAEEAYKKEAALDQDGDGVGEYGTIGKLKRATMLKLAERAGFEEGVMIHARYCFLAFVPGGADEAEKAFAVYAWPKDRGYQTAYFVNELGTVHRTQADTQKYMGTGGRPQAEAAYTGEAFFSEVALGKAKPGNDGNIWRPAGGGP